MNLSLEHRWEHALLAETIAKASEKTSSYLGRTAVQKLIYFMQVLGVPMRYRFEIYHYGPFCSDILQDVEWLIADDVVTDTANEGRYSKYSSGASYNDLRSQYAENLDNYSDQINDVIEAMGDLDPDTLELLATLHFSFRWVKARGGNGPWKELTIAKFKSIKKEKFEDSQIVGWYDTLVEAELIEK